MLKKITRLALYVAVTAPLFILPQANAEQVKTLSNINNEHVLITPTETTAFDLSHSSISRDASLMPLNINTANELELTALPGIGKYKAVQIIQWRERNGEFRTITDLVRVNGIGKVTVTKLVGKISVTDL
ncbi:ComEA family DNA-binding protein [Moritella viscosa]|uniref:Competence protein ComEA helix-hairpin-helix repeat protein n=1 Tax=Moritella viscosa TaxID=80854 RepID=A0A090IIN5_9GAMM|nr:helix-hairpin-helix domain-containing protein [Moritella viscosa]CED60992.1 putative exported protein [Moritella viscosa]SGY95413.1 Competence protein ComEA helix-hairpin-helix repeat protein [Moritella viscosa]SGZ00794.1 Competence protein ComEA helix-hairpin-helix repeat protein [Moritella viscosa]SGZ01192.1 Competence protein ComEA helix-hairpin-helix repeat protein [Moritella viscosa]SGZ07387.1 Competence protein ComEA helix-hairpin-helix repeat protein [Moritella viscosa]